MRYLRADVKALDPDDPLGSFEAVASAPTLDRDNEIIDVGAFEPLPPSVPIHVDHRMAVENVVARGVPFYERDVLKIRGTFATTPRAQEIRRLVADGVVDTVSVGMIGVKSAVGNDGIRHITKAELVEVSFVSVPSNRDARVLLARNFDGRHPLLIEARRAVADAMVTMAKLDLAEIKRLERREQPDFDLRRTLCDAHALLDDLDRKDLQ